MIKLLIIADKRKLAAYYFSDDKLKTVIDALNDLCAQKIAWPEIEKGMTGPI